MEPTNAFGPEPASIEEAEREHEQLLTQIQQHTANMQAAQQALPNLNLRLAVVEGWVLGRKGAEDDG